MILKLIDKVQ
jgi:nucleoside-diphosphate kinase